MINGFSRLLCPVPGSAAGQHGSLSRGRAPGRRSQLRDPAFELADPAPVGLVNALHLLHPPGEEL